MLVMKRIVKLLNEPRVTISHLMNTSLFKDLPDEIFLKIKYRIRMGKKLDLSNPKEFSEKIQWLKIHDRNPHYTKLVDKLEVRNHIKEKIGDDYLIPLIGTYEKFEDIKFDALPNQFVLKSTHDSGGVVICKDKNKFNYNKARIKLNKSLNRNFYYRGREWPYKNVKPMIICEQYLVEREKQSSIIDYKFYCFNGKPEFCQVIRNRGANETIDFYDMEWNHMDFTGLHYPKKPYPHSKGKHPRPDKYSLMIEIARKLSKEMNFIRVDLYYVQDRIFFGELTFYPLSGFGEFSPPLWNKKLGDFIETLDK